MYFLYDLLLKTGIFLEKKIFFKNEKLRKIAAFFFSITSKITSFFYFSKIGEFILGFLYSLATFQCIYYFKILFVLIDEFGFFRGFHYSTNFLPLSIIVVLVFHIILTDLAFLNTLLVSIPSVNKTIKEQFGDDFIKLRFYKLDKLNL